MAQILESMPPTNKGRNARKYPWDTWLDGRVWLLKQGEDFHTKSLVSFRTNLYRNAATMGLRVRTSLITADASIALQAFPMNMDYHDFVIDGGEDPRPIIKMNHTEL
jgi:hypothetical protein